MKRSLLFALSLLNFANPSFAMLDDPLVETSDGWSDNAKDLRPKFPDPRALDSRYDDRSAINENRYPKMVMIHPYNTSRHSTPFSAALLHAHALDVLEDYCAQHFSDYEKIYSFVVQSVQRSDVGLTPQYFAHPDAPYSHQGKDYYNTVKWTVVPGGQGKVEPLAGNLETVDLLSAGIHTHHSGDLDGRMGVSDSVLALKGINTIYKQMESGRQDHCIPSKDAYSLVVFEDGGRKIAAITYHWLLNQGFVSHGRGRSDYDIAFFHRALSNAHTTRELIHALESIPNFINLVPELKKYVGIAIDPELQPTGLAAKIETLPEKFIVTTDYNANANYQLRSHRFAVATGQTISVPYNVTVAEGSRVSLGLLNTNGNGWYGDELIWVPGSYQGIFERIVPENETTAEVVFRNYHLDTPEQSIFTVNYTTVKVDNQPVEIQLTPTDSPVHISRKKGPVKVTTDHNANASYQLESKRFSVKEGERIRIPYDITVEDGGIMSLGLLNASRTGWYPSQVGGETEELILKTGRHKGIFERIIPESEAETSLVFRNYHLGTPGQTVFTITDLKIERGI